MSLIRVAVIYRLGFGHKKFWSVGLKGAQSGKGVSADIFTSDELYKNLGNLSENYQL